MEKPQMLIRPPVKLKEKLKTLAKKKGLTLNGLILMILDDWVGKQDSL